jgi:hypothetical protein
VRELIAIDVASDTRGGIFHSGRIADVRAGMLLNPLTVLRVEYNMLSSIFVMTSLLDLSVCGLTILKAPISVWPVARMWGALGYEKKVAILKTRVLRDY